MLWYYLRILLILFFGLSFFSNPMIANNVLEAQKMLTKLGYAPGPIDGAYGGKTKRALDEYYQAKNKKFDDKLDKNEIVDLTASIKLIKTSRQKLKNSRHIQHARYSKHIETPFRNLKVSEDFTLIDDFDSFMAFHESYLKGKLPDNRGFFNFRSKGQNINFEFCVEDIIRTNRNKAKPTFGMQSATAYCGQMISQRFLNDTQNGIKNYRKIILGWLEGGIIHNPNKFGKKLSKNMMESWPYAISSNVPNILTHYALYHKLYGFSASIHQDIIQMGEAFYAQWDYYPLLIRGMPFKQKLCNLKSQYKVVVGTNDHCGSYTARMATGGIYFGLEFNSQLAFDTGVRHLEIMLATFNKHAVYAAQAQRGICALGYMNQFPPHFELIHYAFQKAYGIDFINTKNINGITPAEAYLKLWEIAHDPLETVVKYWNGFDQMGCSRNGKNQAAMVAQLKKDPSSYQDFWNGFSYEDFLLSSPILASQELPEEWKSLDNAKIKKGEGVLQTVAGKDWVGINPYLLQLALGNFEDIRREYDAERKKKEEKIRKRDKAERLRKREMLFSYDGIYKVQLGQDRNLIDGKIFQDLGSIIFTLKRAQAKLDENNILYGAFGLDEINFSLDYDGYMTVSGQILSNVDTERKCVYIVGNLKSDKNFNPKSNQNCSASGQNFSMKFKKVSDDINFNFAQEEDLKELEGEYDVQWFITGINSTERSLYAKDTLTLSKGVGLFSGSEEDKQPSSELRRELSIQYNANGDIVILGKIDLMEKLDAKQWHASGKIHPNQKTTIKTVWGLGDVIELEIENEELRRKRETEEKKKEAELKKLKEKKRKKEQARLQKRKEEKRKRDKAERLRKREMLLTYDGIYKVQIGLNRDLIDGKMYKDLGSILFSLNRGVPKLDDNNILYKAFGLDEINFSLDYDGYMTVSGQILSKLDTGKKCVYIAGNLKSDKKFNPKSRQNCRASGQNFSMKFKKISDDINFNFAQEEDLKELEGEYDVQWFITGINSTERSLYAKDTLLLSNGVGVFSGNEEDKQPSSELRKELSVQYNANGDIVILGPLDLMEKLDVKQWHASGKIHSNEKTTIRTVWGLGDIIELEIEKSKTVEVSKAIKPKRLIDDGYFIYDKKNNFYQFKRDNEITAINQNDFSLSINSNDEKLFNGDVAYSTVANNFETTWIDLKIMETNEVPVNIKIAFQIEEGNFPNFVDAYSISKSECGIFKDMADDSFIIPLKTKNISELELYDCHIKVLQKNLNEVDFDILKDRINTAISLVDTIEITNKYF